MVMCDPITKGNDDASVLVTKGDGRRHAHFEHVDIRAADAAQFHLEQQCAGSGLGHWMLDDVKGALVTAKHGSARDAGAGHGGSSSHFLDSRHE
jgi:hypothetical protein